MAAALNSAPALPAPCSASRRFQRPLLPSAKTKLSPSEQLEAHKSQLSQLREDLAQTEVSLKEATTAAGGPGSGGTLLRRKGPSKLALEAASSCKEKLEFLTSEIERYETYVGLLEAHLGDVA